MQAKALPQVKAMGAHQAILQMPRKTHPEAARAAATMDKVWVVKPVNSNLIRIDSVTARARFAQPGRFMAKTCSTTA